MDEIAESMQSCTHGQAAFNELDSHDVGQLTSDDFVKAEAASVISMMCSLALELQPTPIIT